MKYEFKVNMITGEYSKNRVEEVIDSVDGVDSVQIDIGSGRVTVEASEEIGLDVFASLVEEAGYVFVWDKEGK